MDENNNNSQNLNTQNEQQTNENTEQNTQKDSKSGQNDKKYSDADVNALIDRKFAEWQKKKDAELGEAKKLAEMDATQKAEYERDKMQKELDLLKKQNLLNEMSKTARGILKESSIEISDGLLSVLVTDNAEATKKNVDLFVQMFNSAVEIEVKNRLKGKAPKGGTKSGTPLTKEQIMNVRDSAERQKLIMENSELFGID